MDWNYQTQETDEKNRINKDMEEDFKKIERYNHELLLLYFNQIKVIIKYNNISSNYFQALRMFPNSKILKIKNQNEIEILMQMPDQLSYKFLYCKFSINSNNDLLNFESNFMDSHLFDSIEDFQNSYHYF